MSQFSTAEVTNRTLAGDLPQPSKSVYVATAAEAHRNSAENRARSWFKDGADPNDAAGNYGFQRLRRSLFEPQITPKFTFHLDDKFYAIGSCFARGIERCLIGQKIAVESAAPEFANLGVVAAKGTTSLGFTNKYNTYSILNELRWALDPDAVFPVESIVDAGTDEWYDPHTNPTLGLVGFDETLARRGVIQKVTRRIADCRGVIITLGLAEVWRDLEADVYINRTPLSALFKTHPQRYEFRLTGFLENWANLEAIHMLLCKHGHPDFRIIVTVSPVPLLVTFSTMDVVLANTYAKSLLRALAQEWAAIHDNVDYYPSYEIVLNSDRDTAWEPDLRHPKGAVTQHVMKRFLKSYLSSERPSQSQGAAAST